MNSIYQQLFIDQLSEASLRKGFGMLTVSFCVSADQLPVQSNHRRIDRSGRQAQSHGLSMHEQLRWLIQSSSLEIRYWSGLIEKKKKKVRCAATSVMNFGCQQLLTTKLKA
jgi:hypothetical protein